MSAQVSPVSTHPQTNLVQSFGDTAFEPNPSFNFGEAHDQDRDLFRGFTPMEDIQSHNQRSLFNPVNGQSSLNQEFPFPIHSNNFSNESMLGQTLNPASVWPSSSPSDFQGGSVPAQSAERRILQSLPLSVSRQHGQITPPDDDEPSGLSKPSGSQVCMDNAAERARNDKSERARNAAVQRHAKTKKQRKDSQQSKSSVSDDDVEDKKEKYREKNRLAAAKCRAKKKDNIEGIEDRHRNLSALNSALKKQVQDLRGELTSLRTVALNHQGCNCRIARYNVNQARKVAMGVDGGTGSPTGYGTFGHDSGFMDCEHGQRSQSILNGSNHSPGMGQMSRNQSFAAPSNYAFASVTTPEEMNVIHGGQGDNEAPFANYLQSGYGGQNGFPQ